MDDQELGQLGARLRALGAETEALGAPTGFEARVMAATLEASEAAPFFSDVIRVARFVLPAAALLAAAALVVGLGEASGAEADVASAYWSEDVEL